MPNPGAPSLQDIFSGNVPAPIQATSPSLPGKPSLSQIFTPGVFNPKPVSQSPFNPNSPNSQFVDPNAPSSSIQSGTNPWSHAFSGTRDALGDVFVKPEQKLLADAGTRIGQASVQVSNEFKNPGYDTAVDTGNPQRKNANGTSTPLPINAPMQTVNTSNSETKISNPQQQLGVTVQPQQQGTKGAEQIGGQALNAADAIGNVAMASGAIEKGGNIVLDKINNPKIPSQIIQNIANGANVLPYSENTWKMVQPELSKTDLAEAVKNGNVVKQGKLGTITQIAKGRNAEMAQAAEPFVSGTKDPIQAVNNMKQGIIDEANKLKTGLQQSDATWSQNNLKGALNKVAQESDNLVGDSAAAFKKTTNAVLKDAQSADKNLSGLLDVRKNFDARVDSQYPNLYDSSNSAIKVAVTKTRNAINQMIEDALPEGKTLDGVSFRDSLKKQSLLYDAIDNTAPKVGKIGSNTIDSFMKANPKITKGIKYGAGALVGGEAIKHFLP